MPIFKKIFSIFLRIGISIILLVFLFKQVDEKSLFALIKNANKPLLLLAFVVYFLTYLFCLLRWEMLLKAVKISLSIKRVIISYAGGTFFSLFLPSTIGGDFIRTIDLAAHTNKPKEVVATVLVDRLSGYIGLAVVALAAAILGWKLVEGSKVVLFSLAMIVFILIAVLLVLFNKFAYAKISKFLQVPNAGKIRSMLIKLHEEIHYFRHNKKLIVKNLALSLLVQIIAPITFYLTGLALGIKINPVYYFVFLPIIGAITMLPISIGGLGLRDATTIFFFAKAGVSKDLAFAMSLINFSFILVYGCLGGILYVLTVRHRRLQRHKPSAIPAK